MPRKPEAPIVVIVTAEVLIPRRGRREAIINLRDLLQQLNPDLAHDDEDEDVDGWRNNDDFARLHIKWLDKHGNHDIESVFLIDEDPFTAYALTTVRHNHNTLEGIEYSYVLKASCALDFLKMNRVPPNSVLGNENDIPISYETDSEGYRLL